ncbi:dihydroceramide fatty acyl 2-hydroxylase FAH2-like isoform X2 [Durio zibethinus]|uniref:Dihydroceramide fatty acyl 2-hydroxylase FAH2-like isoform X2 n=1 Tax=Durio zibethinus TaxID=66656 RepID=A0A6P5X952_DURZI|nr:dihydroceramide fatty acyl 2-hydroxylase FAH2-like isoform X2 [Durio zibethinus]
MLELWKCELELMQLELWKRVWQWFLCAVAKMAAQEFSVDLNKPLVFQVGHLGETYQEWVHQPIVSHESPRFFESDFLEFFTRTVWWVIPTIWLPGACYCISMSISNGHTLPQIALMVPFGMFVWTFLEYCSHRFVFHIETKSYWGNTIHYLLHGCHHKHPMDGLRLVIPPAEFAALCIPFWYLYKLLFTPSASPAFFGGGLIGYVIYDVTHYYVHHGQPTKQVIKSFKKYHLNHHFRIQNKGFGITTAFWDRVFGSIPQTKAAETKTR